MFEKIRVVFTIPELRQKILLTLALLLVYRVGWQIALPVVDTAKMTAFQDSQTQSFLAMVDSVAVFSASQLSNITIFGLGIMPYISASIIFQILATVYPPLEKLQKEGETGRKKINEYTRYATVPLCIVQSWTYVNVYLVGNNLVYNDLLVDGELSFWLQLASVITMTAGTIFLMWIGEQIDEYGIGNGISLLIMAGIVARMPEAAKEILQPMFEDGFQLSAGSGQIGVEMLVVLIGLFLAVVAGVVFITQAQRRIPTQSAKHVRGNKVYGGVKNYLPLRVNQSGVMPIIFASSLLLFPQLILQAVAKFWPWLGGLADTFQRGSGFIYNLCYVALIYFFAYFWTTLIFNPKDTAQQLKDMGAFIAGYRPGRPTADYLDKVIMRITFVGAGFLGVVAIAPTLISDWINIPPLAASFYGGTGLLIAVSVAFDLVQKIDSHLVMRNYKGLTER
jgi:preprotein translocase subunit SecY